MHMYMYTCIHVKTCNVHVQCIYTCTCLSHGVCVLQGKVAEKRALDRSRSLHARVRYIEMVSLYHYTDSMIRVS